MAILVEMADLCHELLTSDAPNDHITMHFTFFLVVLLSNLNVTYPEVLDSDQPVDQFIECLRAAREQQLMQNEA